MHQLKMKNTGLAAFLTGHFHQFGKVVLLCLLPVIRQNVPGALQKVVSEEQASQWVLHPAAHLHQILQDVLTRLREGSHIHHPHGDQQVTEDKTKHLFSFIKPTYVNNNKKLFTAIN